MEVRIELQGLPQMSFCGGSPSVAAVDHAGME